MELVRMTVRAEPQSIPLVQGVTRYYARIQDLPADEIERFLVTVEEAMTQVIEYGFPGKPDSTFDVRLEVEGLDLKVVITDKGIPYDYEKLESLPNGQLSVRLLRGFADRVSLSISGGDGRTQVLMKHLSALPAFKRSETEATESCLCKAAAPVGEPDFHILRKEEAIEVAQCMYDEFGYTYIHEIVYHPDEFYESVRRGECVSMVATAPNGEVMGHVALVSSPIMQGTMEMCMGVVRKSYRGCSVMGELTNRIIDYARTLGLTSINALPVVYHVYTQKICNKQGMGPCGFQFNIINEDLTTSFDHGFRASLGMACLPFRENRRTVHVRKEAAGIAGYVADHSGLDRTVVTVDRDPEAEGETDIISDYDPRICSGTIAIRSVGGDLASKLKAMDRYLRTQGAKSILMLIATGTEQSVLAYDAARSLGYFCTGLFTGCSDDDYLMMEHVVYSTVNYGSLETVDPYSGLLDLIRGNDSDE